MIDAELIVASVIGSVIGAVVTVSLMLTLPKFFEWLTSRIGRQSAASPSLPDHAHQLMEQKRELTARLQSIDEQIAMTQSITSSERTGGRP